MRKIVMYGGLVVWLAVLAGCTGNKEINALNRELDGIHSRLDELTRRLTLLQSEHAALERKISAQAELMENLQDEIARLRERPPAADPLFTAPADHAKPAVEKTTERPSERPAADVRMDADRQDAVGDFLQQLQQNVPAKDKNKP